jgi:dTDP-4-dehydrorhamnose 3,5-epimerase
MKIIDTEIPEVKIIEPKVFGDKRGFFFESYNQREFDDAIGHREAFVQDNHSRSARDVLRGIHYQIHNPQGKLVRVVSGEVFDVAVDLRKSSPTFGKWVGLFLSEENKRQLWVPPGFGHAFLVVSEQADFLYKTTNFYDPASERTIAWNDPDIGIEWPEGVKPSLSEKDQKGVSLAEAEVFV